jgi:HD-GYP domain-containing protein (c-di-GMP phosphodiesterase class II)
MALSKDKKVELFVTFLYPGMILKGDSFSDKGEKINDAFKPVTQEMIDELKRKGIQKVFYTKPSFHGKNQTTNPLVDQPVIDDAVNISRELEEACKSGSTIPQNEINKVVGSFVESVSSSNEAIINLLDLKEFDDYTYTHSINVSILSIMVAKKLNYNEEGLKTIGVSAFLHDIGKTLVPMEILNKPSKLSDEEFEIMKKHPVYSYEIIKSYSSYAPVIQKSVLMHHEKVNGKGYPFGLRGEQLGEIPQIISIADVFDAITSKRQYKQAQPFWYALIEITKQIGISFSPRLAKTFINEMPIHLTETEIFTKGSFVALNTGEIAEVVDYKFPQTLTPFVEIYINMKKEIVRYPILINLALDDSRSIEKVIEDEAIIAKLMEIKNKVSRKKDSKDETAALKAEAKPEEKPAAPVEAKKEEKPEQKQDEKPKEPAEAKKAEAPAPVLDAKGKPIESTYEKKEEERLKNK